MNVPLLVSTNIRSLCVKMLCSLHSNTLVEWKHWRWSVFFKEFQSRRHDGAQHKTSAGVATYISIQWPSKSSIVFNFPSSNVDSAVPKYHPKVSHHCDTIITNGCIAPFCSIHDISLFYDALVSLLSDCFVVGDFTQAASYPLLNFGLADLRLIPT